MCASAEDDIRTSARRVVDSHRGLLLVARLVAVVCAGGRFLPWPVLLDRELELLVVLTVLLLAVLRIR